MSIMLPQPTGAMIPPQNKQLTKNPMLPQLPTTGDLDSQYMAAEAQLRQQVAQQYADILQQLGYVDESGNFLPGSVSVNAARQQSDLGRQSDLAGENVTQQAQQQGTLFSGKRAENTAKAQEPFQRQIAQLGVDTPLSLGHLYEQAAGLVDQYTLQNNLMLAQMAGRRAAAAATNPAGSPAQQGGGGDGGGGDQGGGYEPPPLEQYGQGSDYNPGVGLPPGTPNYGDYTGGGGNQPVYWQSEQPKAPYKKKPMY
jgi:hypothetical protein